MAITEITSAADYRKASNDEETVCIIDAYATWCGPCKAIAPHYEKLAEKYPNIRFYKFDIDQVPEVAQELGASTVPSFSIFKDGMIADGVTGADLKKLETLVAKYA